MDSTILLRFTLVGEGTMKVNGTMGNAKRKADELINDYNIVMNELLVPTTEGYVVKLNLDDVHIKTEEPHEEEN